MWEIVIIGGKLFIFSHKIPSEKTHMQVTMYTVYGYSIKIASLWISRIFCALRSSEVAIALLLLAKERDVRRYGYLQLRSFNVYLNREVRV